MNGKAGIYLRDEQIIVVPEGGGGGYSYDIEPVLVVEATESAITAGVNRALLISGKASPVPPNQKPSISPTLKKLGIRSYKALYRNAAHCYLYEEDDNLMMLKFVPAIDGRGFELTDAPPVPINDREKIGSIVLEYLLHAVRQSA